MCTQLMDLEHQFSTRVAATSDTENESSYMFPLIFQREKATNNK